MERLRHRHHAGIKLTPLIFIPYLLVARKFRQAAMVLAGFVFSVLLGFVILPGDSNKWWFGGLFAPGDGPGSSAGRAISCSTA